MTQVHHVLAVAGAGLSGDRYASGEGTFSGREGAREVTLMEQEAIDAFNASTALPLLAMDTRRNLITRGMRLESLIDKPFRIGAVEFIGVRICPPCSHLARLLKRPDVLKGLARSGGIYARIINGGELAIGQCIFVQETEG